METQHTKPDNWFSDPDEARRKSSCIKANATSSSTCWEEEKNYQISTHCLKTRTATYWWRTTKQFYIKSITSPTPKEGASLYNCSWSSLASLSSASSWLALASLFLLLLHTIWEPSCLVVEEGLSTTITGSTLVPKWLGFLVDLVLAPLSGEVRQMMSALSEADVEHSTWLLEAGPCFSLFLTVFDAVRCPLIWWHWRPGGDPFAPADTPEWCLIETESWQLVASSLLITLLQLGRETACALSLSEVLCSLDNDKFTLELRLRVLLHSPDSAKLLNTSLL